jgi:hypothetical protein
LREETDTPDVASANDPIATRLRINDTDVVLREGLVKSYVLRNKRADPHARSKEAARAWAVAV